MTQSRKARNYFDQDTFFSGQIMIEKKEKKETRPANKIVRALHLWSQIRHTWTHCVPNNMVASISYMTWVNHRSYHRANRKHKRRTNRAAALAVMKTLKAEMISAWVMICR
jgi:hypothetical protein